MCGALSMFFLSVAREERRLRWRATPEARGALLPPGFEELLSWRLGLRLETSIDRTEYGVSWNAPNQGGGNYLGDDVTIKADLALVRQAQIDLYFIGIADMPMAARRLDRDAARGDAPEALLQARQMLRYFVAKLGRSLDALKFDVRSAFHVFPFHCDGSEARSPAPPRIDELLSWRLGQI